MKKEFYIMKNKEEVMKMIYITLLLFELDKMKR